MTARVKENLYALEREPVVLFGRCTGATEFAILKVTVKTGSARFTLGETVTAVGGAGGTGVVYAIGTETGVWDGTTHTGAVVLDLKTITGSFTANDTLTGSVSGVGAQNGSSVADTIYPAVTNVKGKGIASITNNITDAGTPGLYTITLQDAWAGLLMFDVSVISTATADDWEVIPTIETVATTKTIVFQVFKDGAAAHLATTEKLLFEITLSQTTSLPGY
jgi:hypothetical protein